MKLSEITLTVNRHGSLHIPSALLREMGVSPGSHVRLAYLTHNGSANTFQEFLVYSGPDADADAAHISVPTQLLQQADIPANSDLQIVCLKGCMIICQDTRLQPEELLTVLDSLQIANELSSELPDRVEQALYQMEHTLKIMQEEKGELKE